MAPPSDLPRDQKRPHFTPDRASAVQPHLDELAGPPLTSHEVIVNTIAATATATATGLAVTAELDTGSYPKGIKVADEQMKALEQHALRRHDFTASGTTSSFRLPATRVT